MPAQYFGLHYLLRGFAMLTTQGIRRYVILPVLINLALFLILIGTGIHTINYFAHLLPQWLHWVKWIFDTIFFLASSIILVYLFTIVTNLIGAPFNSLLSEKIEILITKKRPNQDEGLKDAIKDIPRTVKREGKKILYYIPRAILLLLLYFIPVVNILVGVLWFVFSSWMMAMEYLDYPMDNHRTTFDDMKLHLRKHCLPSLGFGFSVAVASMIPIINFVVMPAAVIGATLMYIEQQ